MSVAEVSPSYQLSAVPMTARYHDGRVKTGALVTVRNLVNGNDYAVVLGGSRPVCNCPQFEHRCKGTNRVCKHIEMSEAFLSERETAEARIQALLSQVRDETEEAEISHQLAAEARAELLASPEPLTRAEAEMLWGPGNFEPEHEEHPPYWPAEFEQEAETEAARYHREQREAEERRIAEYSRWLERRSEEAAVREEQEPAPVEAEIGGRPVKVKPTGYGMWSVEDYRGAFIAGGLTQAVAVQNARRAIVTAERALWD